MWILQADSIEGNKAEGTFILKHGLYTVGRAFDSDITCDDASMSRQHAQIDIDKPDDPSVPSTAVISDSSRYGTQVNKSKLAKNESLEVKSPSTIKFGHNHFYRMSQYAFSFSVHPSVKFEELADSLKSLALVVKDSLEGGHQAMLLPEMVHLDAQILIAILRGCKLTSVQWVHAMELMEHPVTEVSAFEEYSPVISLPGSSRACNLVQLQGLREYAKENPLQGLKFALSNKYPAREYFKNALTAFGASVLQNASKQTYRLEDDEGLTNNKISKSVTFDEIIEALLTRTVSKMLPAPDTPQSRKRKATDGLSDWTSKSARKSKKAPSPKAADASTDDDLEEPEIIEDSDEEMAQSPTANVTRSAQKRLDKAKPRTKLGKLSWPSKSASKAPAPAQVDDGDPGALIEQNKRPTRRSIGESQPESPQHASEAKSKARSSRRSALAFAPAEEEVFKDSGVEKAGAERQQLGERKPLGDAEIAPFRRRSRAARREPPDDSNIVVEPLMVQRSPSLEEPERASRGPDFKVFRSNRPAQPSKSIPCDIVSDLNNYDPAEFLNLEKKNKKHQKEADELFDREMRPRKPPGEATKRGVIKLR